MRYRKLDKNGDYSFGHSRQDFYIDNPDAVAQAVRTTLLLIQGEWFLDITAGTPYFNQILQENTRLLYDSAIKDTIQGVQGVTGIVAYSSNLRTVTRSLVVSVTISTQFGNVSLDNLVLSIPG